MTHDDRLYFEGLLRSMLRDIGLNSEATVQELAATNERAADSLDSAADEEWRSMACRLRSREHKMVRKIREALARIEDGSFGICEECGEPIATARLKARPVTTYCVACKSKLERDEALKN